MEMLGACVRFSMSGRPRPTESAVESRLIDWLHVASAAAFVAPLQAAPTLPTMHVPLVPEHWPLTEVTLCPAFGYYQSAKLVAPVAKSYDMRLMSVTSFCCPQRVPGSVVGGGPRLGSTEAGCGCEMSSQVSSPFTTGPGEPTEVATNGATFAMMPSSSMKVPSAPAGVAAGRMTSVARSGTFLMTLLPGAP